MVKKVFYLKDYLLLRKKEVLFVSFLLVLMVLISQSGYANHFNLGIAEFFEKFKAFVVYIFRFIAFCAICGIVVAAFSGKISWTIAIAVILGAVVIANIDKILTWIGLTGGVMM